MEARGPAAVFVWNAGSCLTWRTSSGLFCLLTWFLGEEAAHFRYPLEKVGTVMRAIGNDCPAFAALPKPIMTCKVPAEHWNPSTCSSAGQAGPPHRLLLTLSVFALTFPYHLLLRGFTQKEGILEMAILWL